MMFVKPVLEGWQDVKFLKVVPNMTAYDMFHDFTRDAGQ